MPLEVINTMFFTSRQFLNVCRGIYIHTIPHGKLERQAEQHI